MVTEGGRHHRQLSDPTRHRCILLPLSVVFAPFVSQGMLQNLAPYQEVTTPKGPSR
jgi:K+-transporting ATPase A subunit